MVHHGARGQWCASVVGGGAQQEGLLLTVGRLGLNGAVVMVLWLAGLDFLSVFF